MTGYNNGMEWYGRDDFIGSGMNENRVIDDEDELFDPERITINDEEEIGYDEQ